MDELCGVPELLVQSFEYIESHTILKVLSLVCKQWNQLCKADSIWRELTFGELKWPKPTNNIFTIRHSIPQPPSLPLIDRFQDQAMKWIDFFRILKAKSNLLTFRTSQTARKSIVHLINKKLGLTLPSHNNEDKSGVVTILRDVPLIESLRIKFQLMEKQTEVLCQITCDRKHCFLAE
jgi:hypothetical protein